MSGFELVVLLASLVAAARLWSEWYSAILSVSELALPFRLRLVLFALPLACFAGTGYVLKRYSSQDVQDSTFYTLFYLVLAAGWLGIAGRLIDWMGIGARDDVLERRNTAALWPACGAFAGMTCIFAGANVGNGPGVEVVLFSAGLATLVLVALWYLLETLARFSPHEAITIVRDPGAGIRLGGLLSALGMALGWAVAGDWLSVEATIADLFLFGWVSLPLTAMGILVESAYRPRLEAAFGHILLSLGVAGAYLLLAVGWVLWRG